MTSVCFTVTLLQPLLLTLRLLSFYLNSEFSFTCLVFELQARGGGAALYLSSCSHGGGVMMSLVHG